MVIRYLLRYICETVLFDIFNTLEDKYTVHGKISSILWSCYNWDM